MVTGVTPFLGNLILHQNKAVREKAHYNQKKTEGQTTMDQWIVLWWCTVFVHFFMHYMHILDAIDSHSIDTDSTKDRILPFCWYYCSLAGIVPNYET